MSEEAQGNIPRGIVLSDSNQKEWFIGSFIGIDNSAEIYEAAPYHGKEPVHYPALIKLKPHGDKTFTSEIEFFKQHVNSEETAKWLAAKDVHYEYLGLPYLSGSGQNVTVSSNTNFDFLVFERYGSNLKTLLTKHKNIFPTPTVMKLSYHILGVLEYLHQRAIVHGNIQACNIRLDLYDPCVVYLLPQFHVVDESDGNAVTFWSQHQHCGVTTKRGDIESLLYNIIDWSGGILPWKNQLPEVAKNMKIQAFKNPKQFLEDAFPICKCPDPSLCMAARKCADSGKPVAASKCLQVITELMEHLVSLDKTHDGTPNYKIIEKFLKRGLLNMYQVPTSKLEFSIPTYIGDEDHNEKSSRGSRKRVDSYLPGLEVAANTLAIILAENCSSFDEIHTFDSNKACGVLGVLSQMNVKETTSLIKPIIQTAWKENTHKLRTMVVEHWRSKGLKPGVYRKRRKKMRRASTEAEIKVAEMANHESPVQVDHIDERSREEPIAARYTNVDATNSHLPEHSTSKRQKIGPCDESSQRERNFSPSKRRDSISSNLPEAPQESYLPITLSSPLPKSDGIHSPAPSISSSGFSSLHHDEINSYSDDLSFPSMSEHSLQTVHRQLPEEPAPRSRKGTGKTNVVDEQWRDTYELLNTWLEEMEKTLAFGPIPSEPQLVANEVKRVRMICDDFHMRDSRIHQLKKVLPWLPPDSADAENLRRIKLRWEVGLARSENRGRELGEACLGRLREDLQDVARKLDQLSDQNTMEQLLRKVETFAGILERQQTSTGKVIEQLVQSVSDSTIKSNLHADFQNLDKFYEGLKQKIEAKKAKIERNIENERQFDVSCHDIFVWLVDELNGLPEKLLVSADLDTLQKQREDYKVILQRILARETDVIELLEKGRAILSRPRNFENRNSQKILLKSIKSSWNRLVTGSLDRDKNFQTCVEACNKYNEAKNWFSRWLDDAEERFKNLEISCVVDIERQLNEMSALSKEAYNQLEAFEANAKLGDIFFAACDEEESNVLRNDLIAMKDRWCKLNNDLLQRTQSLETMDGRFANLKKSLEELELRMDELDSHDLLRGLAGQSNFRDRIKEAREIYSSLKSSLDAICQLTNELKSVAGEKRIDISNLLGEVDRVADRFKRLNVQFHDRCDDLLEIASFKKELQEPIPSVAIEQGHDVKQTASLPQTACSSAEVIDLVSSDEESELHYYKKIEKKKNVVKRKKDSDPDWNCLSDIDNMNSNGESSPQFVFKKKNCRSKTHS